MISLLETSFNVPLIDLLASSYLKPSGKFVTLILLSSIPTPSSVRLRGILTSFPASTSFEEAPITGFVVSPAVACSLTSSLETFCATTLAVTFDRPLTTWSLNVILPVFGSIVIPSLAPSVMLH